MSWNPPKLLQCFFSNVLFSIKSILTNDHQNAVSYLDSENKSAMINVQGWKSDRSITLYSASEIPGIIDDSIAQFLDEVCIFSLLVFKSHMIMQSHRGAHGKGQDRSLRGLAPSSDLKTPGVSTRDLPMPTNPLYSLGWSALTNHCSYIQYISHFTPYSPVKANLSSPINLQT